MGRKMIATGAVFAAILACGQVASAGTVTFHFNTPYTSSVYPAGGVAPYMTAVFEDVSGGVRLTLSTDGLTEPEFVTAWYFNLDPDMDASKLSFTLDEGATDAVDADKYTFKKDEDDLKLGGQAMGFDFGPTFGTDNVDGTRFNWDETFVGTITTSEAGKTLTANSFRHTNLEGTMYFYGVAKVQGIAPGDRSTKLGAVVIPLPGAVWGGFALFGVIASWKMTRRQLA